MARYIFIVGGVMSSIGKGVTAASLGQILKSRGFKVTAIKIDPYINVDAGTMNPVEHGEVFVTKDGMECDQDIGNYERFLNQDIPSENYMTTGAVYNSVITRERNLEYNGKCVEVVPHIPNEVIERIKKAAKNSKADFVLIEIGGTVGEYQNLLFLEAARMMKLETPKDVLFFLVSYLPVPNMVGEMKTKPTQYAVRTLNSAGIQPDFIIARSELPIDEPRKKKLSMFCNISPEDVIAAPDIKSIYEIPINFEKDRIGDKILKKFGISKGKKSKQNPLLPLVKIINKVQKPVKIGIVGKYFETGDFTLADSYLSVIESIKHAAWSLKRKPEITWINSVEYEKNPKKLKELSKYDGIIIPGGFGGRGVEGKIMAIEYARKNKIPFFGLCYGMQLAVIEFGRNVCKLKGAHTTEIDQMTSHPIIDVMPDQIINIKEKKFGGSMRLGTYPCELSKGTISQKAYGLKNILERHRHRYEFNNEYRDICEKNGMVFSGINPERDLVEIIELKNHPFFVGVQFHPEFLSRPLNPHPLFREFVRRAILA